MNEDLFWEIIEKSECANYEYDFPEGLVCELKKLTPELIIEFYEIYHVIHEKADMGNVWAAGMLLNGGHGSDSGFIYFRNWLIAQGRETFEKTIADPDSLALIPVDADETGRPYTEWERFGYAPSYAFEEVTTKNMYDELNPSSNKAMSFEKNNWDWQDYTDEVLAEKFPKLWGKYGKYKIEFDNRPSLTQYGLCSIHIGGLGQVTVGDVLMHNKYGLGTVKSIEKQSEIIVTTLLFSEDKDERHMIIDGHSGLWTVEKQAMK